MEKVCMKITFKADFALFDPTRGLLSPLIWCKSYDMVHQGVCTSSRLVPMQMGPSTNIVDTQTKKWLFFFDKFCPFRVCLLLLLLAAC